MSLFGKIDQPVTANTTTLRQTTAGAPIGTYVMVSRGGGANAHFGNTSAGSRASFDVAMYNNSSPSAFVTGKAVGVFGIDVTEAATANGGVTQGFVMNTGSGYIANATVTLTATNGGASAVANAQANSLGKIAAILISTAGSGYNRPPTVAVSAPSAQTFTASTGVTGGSPATGANGTITLAAAGVYSVGDPITYTVSAGNTAVSPLVSGTRYFINFANASVIALASTSGGNRIVLVPGSAESGHTLQGDTATGAVIVGGVRNNGAAHAGWNLVTIGTGGRAGRVHYETLVAFGSLT